MMTKGLLVTVVTVAVAATAVLEVGVEATAGVLASLVRVERVGAPANGSGHGEGSGAIGGHGIVRAAAVVRQDGQEPQQLIADLSAADAATRAMAACRIGRLRSRRVAEEAMDLLLEMLGDETPVEPRLCRDRDRQWGVGGRLESSSPGREAALALERAGRQAVDPLADVLASHDSPVARRHAALTLGLIEDRRALDALAAALADDVAEVRVRSAWALGMLEHVDAVESLAAVVDDADAEVREQAAWALGMIESSEGVPALRKALQDRDARVREQAAWGLGMIESSAAVEGLLAALDDEDPEVREQVAWALGMIEDPAAVDGLIEALEDDDTGVRRQVVWALMRVVDHLDDAEIDYERIAEALRRARQREGGR